MMHGHHDPPAPMYIGDQGAGRTLLISFGITLLLLSGLMAFLYSIAFHEKMKFHDSDSSNFDAIAAWDEVHEFAGKEYSLHVMDARWVRSDGTIDLGMPRSRVVWSFTKPSEVLEVRATDFGTQMTGTDSEGNPEGYLSLGLEREQLRSSRPLPAASNPPKCSFAKMWEDAIAAGASVRETSKIRYSEGIYEFELRRTDFRMRFDSDCRSLGTIEPSPPPEPEESAWEGRERRARERMEKERNRKTGAE